MPIGVVGIGAHVPPTIVTNDDIARWADVTPQWVGERTGIEERRYAPDGTATSDLAVPAAHQALAAVPEAAARLRALVVGTCTPDSPQPSTAAVVQDRLGLGPVPAFDLNAVCSGFLYSMVVAERLLAGDRDGGYALVVGADMFSRIMNRRDRRTVSLFGDGAGAVLLGEVPEGYGLLASRLATHGEFREYVGVAAGGTRIPLDDRAVAAGDHLFRMDGRAVRDYAMDELPKLLEQTLGDCGMGVGDIDRFVFHQPNTRMLEALAERLGAPLDRFAMTAPHLGNTAAASVPLTLHAAHTERPFQRGERILLASIGGGMTVGAAVLVWY
ncbi:3-oxoacyl-ACP synthase III family protein [Streptomyces cellulosae]|uniref:3-oxoacyl-ACP synthase III family protein n=1 Tax=Streptomyces cellulosae TaxID=1968 RepID=UPI0004CC7762|nr:ketoacyl-ACP synthase III [Streptomyces cellulosae]